MQLLVLQLLTLCLLICNGSTASDNDVKEFSDNKMEPQQKCMDQCAAHNLNIDSKIIKIGVLLPKYEALPQRHQVLATVIPVITLATEHVKSRADLLPGHTFEIISQDTNCSAVTGPVRAMEMYNSRSPG